MRLICPNCGAQYEIDESVIPDGGRDVQCANCGHTWFQRPPHFDRALAEELGHAFPENVDIGDTPPEPQRPPARERPATPRPAPGPEAAAMSAAATAALGAAASERRRRELNPEVADMLREEAAREKAAREAEREGQDGLESQPDLGLDSGPRQTEARVAPTRAHVRTVTSERPEAQDAGAEQPMTPGARRDAARRAEQLPDIEEINSTLRPSAHARGGPADSADTDAGTGKTSNGGFRTGFLLVIVAAVAATAAYIFAPQIAGEVPGLAEPLETYVAWVNDTRPKVDAGLQDALVRAQDFTADMVERVQAIRGGSEAVE
ncbi:zinc-ribbon domain-containing protein [Anianabacter salinae]|uniref:zinc-ribbon domain-containing protein n=1 Tax=Anianabacter salinae TaxID=2851023 RepID=UPI00225E4298|nr:zinc-ribbon domain-containing protein [Anianabacter salinae]MBV0913230.1 zinc-ribbon domain-containing protein [Anianabacter salinae]